jgi:23S rRNA G2069 N7-methylase RlmK/C1962 C5-methylase RlmI
LRRHNKANQKAVECYDAASGERCPVPAGWTHVVEGGVKYAVDLEHGHKTGRDK